MESEKPDSPKKRYLKLKLWQWVVLYIVAAVILYGLFYLLFFQKGGTSSGSSGGY